MLQCLNHPHSLTRPLELYYQGTVLEELRWRVGVRYMPDVPEESEEGW